MGTGRKSSSNGIPGTDLQRVASLCPWGSSEFKLNHRVGCSYLSLVKGHPKRDIIPMYFQLSAFWGNQVPGDREFQRKAVSTVFGKHSKTR